MEWVPGAAVLTGACLVWCLAQSAWHQAAMAWRRKNMPTQPELHRAAAEQARKAAAAARPRHFSPAAAAASERMGQQSAGMGDAPAGAAGDRQQQGAQQAQQQQAQQQEGPKKHQKQQGRRQQREGRSKGSGAAPRLLPLDPSLPPDERRARYREHNQQRVAKCTSFLQVLQAFR